MFIFAKLNDAFRRLLNKASSAVATVEALVALAQQAAAEAAASAEAATGTLPIETIIVDPETGAIGFVAKPGEFRLFSEALAQQGADLVSVKAQIQAAEGEIALKASRETFDDQAAVAHLREAVEVTAAEAATFGFEMALPLTAGLGTAYRAGDVVAVETAGGPVRFLLSEDVAADVVDVPVVPGALSAAAGAAVYEPAREAYARISALYDLIELDVDGSVLGTPLIGVVATDVAAGEGVTEIPLEAVEFGPLEGEFAKVKLGEATLTLTVAEDLDSTTDPATLVLEPFTVPEGGIPAGTEVRLSAQTLASLVRQTRTGRTTLISRADLDPEAGAYVYATLSQAVAGTAIDELPVGAAGSALQTPKLLVVVDAETDELFEVYVTEDVAAGAVVIPIDPARIGAVAGSEVIVPASSAWTRTIEEAGRFAREVAATTIDGEGLVTRTEFLQTTDEIRGTAEAGDLRSLFGITADSATILGGRSVVIGAGKHVIIGSAFFGGTAGGPLTLASDNGIDIQGGGDITLGATLGNDVRVVVGQGSQFLYNGAEVARVGDVAPRGTSAVSLGYQRPDGSTGYLTITDGSITSIS